MVLWTAVGGLALGTAVRAGEEPKGAVRVVAAGAGFQLLRDGKPYFIRGAGGEGSRELLAQVGGNSVRVWGTENLQAKLDQAHKLGLTIAVGIWLGHERHGFNYNDANQVAKQADMVRETILRYKNHPAVLLWALGNEMEGYEKGDNAAIWSAIQNLAVMAKKLDPNHPTMTVVAEIGGERVKSIHRLCPDIDIVGINTYAGLGSIPKRYKEAGGTKPYIIAEFGPPGIWESPKTSWGVAPELSSTEKAEVYRKNYTLGVAGAKDLCLGSYAFLWGAKQEATATWFGMLLPDGKRLAAVDALQELWSGKPPTNRCPRIDALNLQGPNQVEPGTTVRVDLKAADPEGDPLAVRWVLQRESVKLGVGGDAEEAPPSFPDAILKGDLTGADVKLPKGGGGYRLFAFVSDDRKGAAVANVPLFVKGPIDIPKASVAKLPLVIYDEADQATPPFAPTGWMGNTKSLKVDPAWTTDPQAGKTCMRVAYEANDNWSGVVWQNPPNDWGALPGGWNLTGAKRLSFWARGDKGGEVVSFEFGLLGKEKTYFDTGRGKLDKIDLTPAWKQYSIDVGNQDLSRIKTGFAFVVAGQNRPVVFYLDAIRFE